MKHITNVTNNNIGEINMKKISYQKMADLVIAKRKEKKLTQAQLAEMTGIHRAMISRLEALDYSID